MSNNVDKSILLIDDNTSLLTALGDFLAFEGYDVATAANAEQALKKLESMTPDIIILDISMPGMGGIGFLKRISNSRGELAYPVLVLTARANMADFFEDVSVDGFVTKPCNPNTLLMEVRRIIFLRSGDDAPQSEESPPRFKVLIGENDEGARGRLSEAFAGRGDVVESVASGPEVVEKAITSKPDIIVVKMVLQNMNGKAVAEMLKLMPNTKDVPVVLYDNSSGVTLPKVSDASGAGGIRAVVTSDNATDVVAAVDRLFSR